MVETNRELTETNHRSQRRLVAVSRAPGLSVLLDGPRFSSDVARDRAAFEAAGESMAKRRQSRHRPSDS